MSTSGKMAGWPPMAAHAAATGKMHFFLTAWESKDHIVVKVDKANAPRSLGYNASSLAFPLIPKIWERFVPTWLLTLR